MPDTVIETRIPLRWADTDALGEVSVLVEHQGRLVSGQSVSTDTLEASARANGGVVVAGDAVTDLCVLPGDDFHVVTDLITNFHLPRSTLLMLVSALAGLDHILAAYETAKREGYRFYSFGDAMLIR